jgi:hypothetical protein
LGKNMKVKSFPKPIIGGDFLSPLILLQISFSSR